ncbi:MAG: extracellular solute-binding protein [Streptosporangiales bacterium]|nr:extracellular solute-binding protein [Streptosporangiales bacterium]
MSLLRRPVREICGAAIAGAVLVASACSGGDIMRGGGGSGEEGPLVVDGEQIADAKLYGAAQEEGSLTLYTALSTTRELAIDAAFEKDTGLTINMVRLPGGRLYSRVVSEHKSGKLRADVIRQTDRGLADSYLEEGVWQPYCAPFLEKVEEKLKGPDCNFWASQTPFYALGYNTELVKESEAPRTWDDLLDPQWKGKIGMAYIGAGGSTWARDLFLRKEKGLEYWKRLAAQKPVITGSAGSVTELNARGEVPVAVVLPGTQLLAKDEGAPLAVTLPEDGLPSYAQWLGLTAEASNPNAAKVFLNWSASRTGQTAVAAVGDYPVRSDAPGPKVAGVQFPARDEVNLIDAESWDDYASKREQWMDQWLNVFGYTPKEGEEEGG